MSGDAANVPESSGPFRVAALSIDLDGVELHRRVHGLPSGDGARAVVDLAVSRALAFASRHTLPITFFAISDDWIRDDDAARLRAATEGGHLVESHSKSHPYDLVRQGRAAVYREIAGSFEAIERATGRRPVGFRAPGYAMSNDVLDALESVGAHFDSSVFPSPPYYVAKLGALGAMAVRGRRSSSVVGTPRMLGASTEPYRLGDRAWQRGRRSLVELPIRVTRGLRLPVTGTTVALTGERVAPWLVNACGNPPLFNFALHGIDFLDASDGLRDLAPFEPTLGVSREARERAFGAVVESARRRGYVWVTLASAVRRLEESRAIEEG